MKLINIEDISLLKTVSAGGLSAKALWRLIKSQRTVDAVPVRHGHWIFNPKDAIEMMFTLPKCSECGAESPNGGNYCPNCGAKMDVEKENESNI